MGTMQRRKGMKWEQEVARRFAAAGWDGAKRGIGQPRAGNEVPDVDVPTLWPECKHGQKTNPRAALAQATKAAGKTGRVPVAITRDNGEPPIVTLRLDDFLELVPPPGDRPQPALDDDDYDNGNGP